MISHGYVYGFAIDHPEHLPPPLKPEISVFGSLWVTICPVYGKQHGKNWHIETDICLSCQEKRKENYALR